MVHTYIAQISRCLHEMPRPSSFCVPKKPLLDAGLVTSTSLESNPASRAHKVRQGSGCLSCCRDTTAQDRSSLCPPLRWATFLHAGLQLVSLSLHVQKCIVGLVTSSSLESSPASTAHKVRQGVKLPVLLQGGEGQPSTAQDKTSLCPPPSWATFLHAGLLRVSPCRAMRAPGTAALVSCLAASPHSVSSGVPAGGAHVLHR